MTKILHVTWDGHIGGTQRYLHSLLTSKAWAHCRHTLCLYSQPGALLSQETLRETPVHSLGVDHGWQFFKARKMTEWISEIEPDLIHCHCDTPLFLVGSRQFKEYPIVMHEHGDTQLRGSRKRLARIFWLDASQRIRRIIVNSKSTYTSFINVLPQFTERCTILPNPWTGSPPSEGISKHSRPTIGVFSRLVESKGIDWLLKCVPQIARSIPDVEVAIYGEGPFKQDLIELSQQMHLERWVSFKGFSDAPLKEMQRAHCVVIPSKIEPFGLVALEAMGVGTPVVGFRGTGIEESVVDGQTGFLVPYGEIEQLGSALIRLLSKPELCQQMGSAAQKHCRENFSLEKHIQKLETLYSEVLSAQLLHTKNG